MATVTITKPMTTCERDLIIAAHNAQSAVIEGRAEELRRYHWAPITDLLRRTFEVKLLRVVVDNDPKSHTFSHAEIVIDLLDEGAQELARFIEDDTAGTYGWQVLPNGHVKAAGFTGNRDRTYSARLCPQLTDTENIWSPVAFAHDLKVWIDTAKDGKVPIDLTLADPDGDRIAPLKGQGSAELNLIHGNLRGSASPSYRSALGVAVPQVLSGEMSAWDYMEIAYRHEGYDVSSLAAAKLAGRGGADTLGRGMGVPKDPLKRAAIADPDTLPENTCGKRMLDISDVLDTIGPEKGASGVFPPSVTSPTLIRHTRHVEPDHSVYRRNRNTVTYRSETAGTALVFGLTHSHSGLTVLNLEATARHYPVLDKHRGEIANFWWAVPAARLMITRSAIGWHGVFMLPVEVVTDSYRTPCAHFAYMIPVFMAHDETKYVTERYRYLPAEVITAIRATHGLANFLQHALHALAGAKLKAKRAGKDLDALLPANVTPLPGHMLCTWGAARSQHAWGIEDAYSRIGKPATSRVGYVAGYLLGFAYGAGNVTFGVDTPLPQAANDLDADGEEEVQLVATRRVLQL